MSDKKDLDTLRDKLQDQYVNKMYEGENDEGLFEEQFHVATAYAEGFDACVSQVVRPLEAELAALRAERDALAKENEILNRALERVKEIGTKDDPHFGLLMNFQAMIAEEALRPGAPEKEGEE